MLWWFRSPTEGYHTGVRRLRRPSEGCHTGVVVVLKSFGGVPEPFPGPNSVTESQIVRPYSPTAAGAEMPVRPGTSPDWRRVNSWVELPPCSSVS